MNFEWCPFFDKDEESIFKNIRYSLGQSALDHDLVKEGKRVDGSDQSSLDLTFKPLAKGKYSLFCEIEFVNGKKALLRYEFAVARDDQYHEVPAVELAAK